MFFSISPQTECCANCQHYRQHFTYLLQEHCFCLCNAGHCCYPRMKNREPMDVCQHFVSASSADGKRFRADLPIGCFV